MGLSVKDCFNLLFMLGSSGLIAYGPMAHEQGGPGIAFTYHPFLMGIGFSLFITLGFWMFNYEDLPGEWIDTRASRRKVHAICQVTGAFCIVAGYIAVVQAHGTKGASLFQVSEPPMGFSSGPGWVRLIHIILGYLALCLLVAQVFLGFMKYKALSDENEDNDEAFAIHEQVGNFFYFCGIGNVLLGVWLWEAWSLPVRCVITLTMLTSVAFGPRWDGTHGFLGGAEEHAHHHHRNRNRESAQERPRRGSRGEGGEGGNRRSRGSRKSEGKEGNTA